MIQIMLIDIDVSTHEEFAELMMGYGSEGFKYAYRHEEFESTELFLTDQEIKFDDYEDEMEEVGKTLQNMRKNGSMNYELSDGLVLTLLKG